MGWGEARNPLWKPEARVVEAASSKCPQFQEESAAETSLLERGVLVKSDPNSEFCESLHLPKVLWGNLTILRDRKLSILRDRKRKKSVWGLFYLVSKEAPRAKRRAQLSPGKKAELGQGARGRSPGKVRRGGKQRARGPTRKFWLLPWLRELCPAGAASSLPGQGCSSDQPSLARAAQPQPAAPTPPRDSRSWARKSRHHV